MPSEKEPSNAPRFSDEAVARVFAEIPDQLRERLLELRSLIFETAAELPGVGPIEEALRWGEPSYLTSLSKSGTTIRIHWKARRPEMCALYVHCQTNLMEQFRRRFAGELSFEGTRGVLFRAHSPLPTGPLRECIRLALTYHRSKSR